MNKILLLNVNQNYSWDYIIICRRHIKEFADWANVNQDYLTCQINFLKGVTSNNKMLAIASINQAIDRLNEKLL